MEVNYTLFDMKRMVVEREGVLDMNKLLKEYLPKINQNQESFSSKGLKVYGFNLSIDNEKKFIRYIFYELFKDYSVLDTQGYHGGHPDYILEKNGEKIYVEIKLFNDSLRISQLKYFINNKNQENKLLQLSWNVDRRTIFEDEL